MQTETSRPTADATTPTIDPGRDASGPCVFLDVDGVILETRPMPRGRELLLRPGAVDGLRRLSQVAGTVVLLLDPSGRDPAPGRDDSARRELLRSQLDGGLDLTIVGCPHPSTDCGCRKPAPGLVELARVELALPRGGWHIGGDQAGVQAGRSSGLRTIRVGPPAEDHLSTVHRADYEARDLLDAANWILVESLSAP